MVLGFFPGPLPLFGERILDDVAQEVAPETRVNLLERCVPPIGDERVHEVVMEAQHVFQDGAIVF